MRRTYKGKNVAILNDKTTYGKGLADETKKALNKAGFTEKMFESYNKGDKDFNAIVSRLKRDNIDLVYVGGYHQESGLILRQMRDQGLKTVLMAGDALADKEFASITGPAGEGTLFTFGPDPRNKPTAKAIVEKFKAKNIDPEGYTLYTYAAMQVWSQAVKKAGTTDPKKVMDTIKARRVGYRDRQDGVRRQGRHQADRLCRLQMGRQGQLYRDQSEGIVERSEKFDRDNVCNAPVRRGVFVCGRIDTRRMSSRHGLTGARPCGSSRNDAVLNRRIEKSPHRYRGRPRRSRR